MAVRANEYAPPACGSAGDISAMEKHSPMYITVITATRDQHAAEAAGRQSEIPAEEIARDDRAHPHGPQLQHARVAPQAALREVGGVRWSVTNRQC